MDVHEFARMVTAALVANILTLGAGWAVWQITKLERGEQLAHPGLGKVAYAVMLVVGLAVLGNIWLSRTPSATATSASQVYDWSPDTGLTLRR